MFHNMNFCARKTSVEQAKRINGYMGLGPKEWDKLEAVMKETGADDLDKVLWRFEAGSGIGTSTYVTINGVEHNITEYEYW